MIKNKKSIMFTFIAITLLMVILISFLITMQTSTKTQTDKIMAKATSINAFVQNIDINMQSSLKASGNQVVLALEDYMDVRDVYLAGNSNVVFREAITQGTYQGSQLRMMKQVVQGEAINFTIGATLSELRVVASRSNIVLSFDELNANDISFTMKSPWTFGMDMQVKNVKVMDKEQELVWDLGTFNVAAELKISRYRDPFYLVSDDVNISVQKTNTTEFETSNQLNSFITNFEFYNHTDAPDFTQRMFGQFDSSSVNGYETILGSAGHNPNTPNPSSNSYADFIYWGTKASAIECNVAGVPGIKLDNEHKLLYTGIPCEGI